MPKLANMNDTDGDNILCFGDSFKLKSKKFPNYEMGVTSVRIANSEVFYLGLRKSDVTQLNMDNHSEHSASEWSQSVHFVFK